MTHPLAELRNLYDDVELAILFDWLRLERPAPLGAIDLATHWEEHDAEPGPIRPRHSDDGYGERNAVSNAVARLVLQSVASRLPQWVACYADGSEVSGRHPMPRRPGTISLMPRYLFMVNWADSGPGYSWPESYHATYLPGFDVFVVTGSMDSPDAHGYTDLAIGYIPAGQNLHRGIKPVIQDWWVQTTNRDPDQAWQHLWESAAVSAEDALAWGQEIWGDPDNALIDLSGG